MYQNKRDSKYHKLVLYIQNDLFFNFGWMVIFMYIITIHIHMDKRTLLMLNNEQINILVYLVYLETLVRILFFFQVNVLKQI